MINRLGTGPIDSQFEQIRQMYLSKVKEYPYHVMVDVVAEMKSPYGIPNIDYVFIPPSRPVQMNTFMFRSVESMLAAVKSFNEDYNLSRMILVFDPTRLAPGFNQG